jgi:hypothetical protein
MLLILICGLCLMSTFNFIGERSINTVKKIYEERHLLKGVVREYVTHNFRQILINYTESGKIIHSSKHFDITYYDGNTKYCIRIPKKRGPKKYNMVYDENDNDITTEVEKFMGINKNFHNIPTTPSLLGYNTLKYKDIHENEFIFDKNDIIHI